MTIVYKIFSVLVLIAHASDPRERSRSRDVETYLRSMTKIKPQWSEEKILRHARRIYGPEAVPSRISSQVRHVPGKVQSRPGSVPVRVVGMSADEKRREVQRIRRENPDATALDILELFRAENPVEPNPPDLNLVRRHMYFQKIEERLESVPEGMDWNTLGPEAKSGLNRAGTEIMKRRYLENPTELWEELVAATVIECRQKYGVRLSPGSVYKWYLNVRKEALGHGSKRGPRMPQRRNVSQE